MFRKAEAQRTPQANDTRFPTDQKKPVQVQVDYFTTFVCLGNKLEGKKNCRREWKLPKMSVQLKTLQPRHQPANKGSVCVFCCSRASDGMFYSIQDS